MEKRATVACLLPDGRAELLVVRESACSGDCHHCAGCGAVRQTLRVTAENAIGACRGDVVLVASADTPVLVGAVLVYLLPLALFLAVYLAATAWAVAPLLPALVAFALGMLPAFVYNRRLKRRPPTYQIIDFVK